MSGVACAKVIIDNGRDLNQRVTTQMAAIDRAIGCMSNSILLASSKDEFPTEEMEDEFLAAASEFRQANLQAADKLLKCAAKIGKYCDDASGVSEDGTITITKEPKKE